MANPLFGKSCDCSDSPQTITQTVSLSGNWPCPDDDPDCCGGDARTDESSLDTLCWKGKWHGVLSIEGFDDQDQVYVYIVDEDGGENLVAQMTADESVQEFDFDNCSCGAGAKVQTRCSDIDGCSMGWSGTLVFTFVPPP